MCISCILSGPPKRLTPGPHLDGQAAGTLHREVMTVETSGHRCSGWLCGTCCQLCPRVRFYSPHQFVANRDANKICEMRMITPASPPSAPQPYHEEKNLTLFSSCSNTRFTGTRYSCHTLGPKPSCPLQWAGSKPVAWLTRARKRQDVYWGPMWFFTPEPCLIARPCPKG